MLKIFASLCLFAVAFGANIPLDAPGIQEHIVGGKNTDISQVPYQVAMFQNGAFKCGGSIVSATHIVTAAHCLYRTPAQSLSFRAGSSNVYQGGVVVKAKAAYYHNGWTEQRMDYDVGVVELATPLQFSNNIKPIRLGSSEPSDNSGVLVSGWGLLRENGQMSQILQSVVVPVVNKATCSNWLQKYLAITPRMLCAGVEGKDSCQGDSGGPLAYNGQLVGIVSFGIGCARRNLPGVYASIANPDISGFIRRYAKV